VGTLGGHAAVDRKGAEQGQQNEQDGRDGRQDAGRQAAMPGW
jgi:hypothetical protein